MALLSRRQRHRHQCDRYANKGRKAIDVPNVTLAVLRARHPVDVRAKRNGDARWRRHTTCACGQRNSLACAPRLLPLASRPVCYGFTDSYGQCVYGRATQPGLANRASPDYRRLYVAQLGQMAFIYRRLARRAFGLRLEADVVILTNPWPLLLSETEKFASVHDAIRYQFETPPCTMPEKVQSPAVACTKSDWPAFHLSR